MGIPLRPFKQTPKSPTSVVDALPPVFTTHEELHKGSRREAHQQSLQHSQHQQQSLQPPHRTASLPQPHGNKVGPDTTGPAGGGSGSATPASAGTTAIHKKTGLLPPTVPNRPTSATVTSPAAVTTVPPGLSGPNHAHTNGTSSTALWIASANAAAAATRTSRGHSSQAVGALESASSTSSASSRRQHPTLTGRTGSDRSLGKHSSGTNHTLESYYEEEVLEDDDDEGDFFEVDSEDDDAMLKGGDITGDDGDGDDVDLNLFPERNPTIRFDEYDEMQTVLHINDYTKHEIHRAWYRREDYDKMVQLARKTAEKAEQRKKELEEYQKQHEVVQKQVPSSKAGDDNGGSDDDDHDDDDGGRQRLDSNENRQDRGNDGKDKITTANGKEKMKKPIEYRGLEAWTASGAAKVKLLKESAIELVWNEQSRQWDAGQFNPDAIREVYLAVSRTAQQAAWDRGMSDALIVERLRELEEAEAEKKRRRKILGKSKALFTKSVRLTGKGVKKTGQLVHKTTKVTTKVAKEATKRSVKAGVATATLDPRMMKEALKVSLKKRECKHEVIRKPSQSHIQEHKEETDHDADDGSVGAEQSTKSLVDQQQQQQQQHQQQEQSQQRRLQFPSQRDASDQSLGAEQQPQIDQSMTTADESFDQDAGPANGGVGGTGKPPSINTKDGKAKKSKLKLLGVVPIPGTKKVYKEDRREKKAEKRIQKQARRPAWEANVSTGKY